MLLPILASVAALAFANGANDNFKGVATLYGSGVTRYGRALSWATLATFAGCLAAAWLAHKLAVSFSGRAILDKEFLTVRVAGAVCLAAGGTVLLATLAGMPVSTTHALVGGLLGAAVSLQGWAIHWAAIGWTFLLPLATSPLISAALAFCVTRGMSAESSCVCLEATPAPDGSASIRVVADTETACERAGAVPVVSGRILGRGLHYVSAGAVGFARGLNDTPKIAAALLLVPEVGWNGGSIAVLGLVMALGGLLGARRVARTMSRDITPMTDRQGLATNLVTSALVISASVVGLPVSTTHVSCGALAGLGLARGGLAGRRFLQILAAWGITLPFAALLASIFLALPR
ncbi:MAG: inorganic phosphate transporter [Planctomycetes bacterium]|nr:inorganic phosphate transporter [Planctomycetota bacterium]